MQYKSKNKENRIRYKTNWFDFIVEMHPVLREPNNLENYAEIFNEVNLIDCTQFIFSVFRFQVVAQQGLMGWMEAFVCELAHKEKHAYTTLET